MVNSEWEIGNGSWFMGHGVTRDERKLSNMWRVIIAKVIIAQSKKS
jgi:hypothetical protein